MRFTALSQYVKRILYGYHLNLDSSTEREMIRVKLATGSQSDVEVGEQIRRLLSRLICLLRYGFCRLYVETEVHYVTVLDYVFFAFD